MPSLWLRSLPAVSLTNACCDHSSEHVENAGVHSGKSLLWTVYALNCGLYTFPRVYLRKNSTRPNRGTNAAVHRRRHAGHADPDHPRRRARGERTFVINTCVTQPKRWHAGRLDRVDHLFGSARGERTLVINVPLAFLVCFHCPALPFLVCFHCLSVPKPLRAVATADQGDHPQDGRRAEHLRPVQHAGSLRETPKHRLSSRFRRRSAKD